MKKNRWFIRIATLVLVCSVMQPFNVEAKGQRELKDESIYDLLIDRFYNGNFSNDQDVDTQDMHAFSGGDFAGIMEKSLYIKDMGFTLVSIGSVFETARYDGNEVLSYGAFDPHFGTEEEFIEMIDLLASKELGTVVDFPLNGISDQHEWILDNSLSPIVQDGQAQWDLTQADAQAKLKEAILTFVEKYDGLAGIRLTHLGNAPEDFLNDVIQAIQAVNSKMYILSNEPSTADFDLMPNLEKSNALKEAYILADSNTAQLDLFSDGELEEMIQLDGIDTRRFTDEVVELQKFPPTRWKLATTALFMLPGVPVFTYESENAVTGKEFPDIHPIVNFKTDPDLYDHVKALNKVRNSSETLRTGKFDLLFNENGFTVFSKTSDEETWIVAINNTSTTSSLEISPELIGDEKRFRGLLDNEHIIQGKDGLYRIVLERELAEIYIVEDDRGFNTPYLIVTILVYTSFFVLIFVLLRRSKRNSTQES